MSVGMHFQTLHVPSEHDYHYPSHREIELILLNTSTPLQKNKTTPAHKTLIDLLRSLRGKWCPDRSPSNLGRLLKAESFLDRVALLSEQNNDTGHTVLHVAAIKCTESTIKTVMDCIVSEYEASQLLAIQDKCGCTPIHLAVQSSKVEILDAMINQVKNCGAFSDLLKIQNRSGNTALHQADSKAMADAMLDLLTLQQEDQLLDVKNKFGLTALESARKGRNAEMANFFGDRYTRQLSDSWEKPSWHAITGNEEEGSVPPNVDTRTEMLEHLAKNEYEQFGVILESEDSSEINRYVVENGGEVFHKLLKRCFLHNQVPWRRILQEVYLRLNGETRLQLLLSTDDSGRNTIRRCIKYKSTAIIRILLAALSPSQCEQVICQQDQGGLNCIQDGAFTGGFVTLEVIVNRLSPERRVELLAGDRTWIELGFENPNKLNDLLGTDDCKLWFKLVSATNDHCCNAIQVLTERANIRFLEFLLAKLNSEQILAVIEHYDNLGFTALDICLDNWADNGPQLTELLLTSLEPEDCKSIISSAANKSALFRHIIWSENINLLSHFINTVSQDFIDEELPKLIDQEALSTSQIEVLYPLSYNYIIPRRQDKAKKVAFICFNSENRDGAHQEAALLSAAFRAQGFCVRHCEWMVVNRLQDWISAELHSLGSDISLLFICTMSHGFRGHIGGECGSYGEISNLIHRARSNIPSHTPLVMLIQACQNFVRENQVVMHPNADPAEIYNPEDRRHIVLRRPHTALLLATVTGGQAIRGAYTGAMAEELRHVDKHRDIHQMHQSAVHSLSLSADTADMIPEYRDTLRKCLIIPQPPDPSWY